MRRRMLLTKAIQPPVENYLRVTPVDVLWIIMSIPILYLIESNVDWHIE